MKARWIMPVICYGLLIAVETFAVSNILFPITSVFAFIGLYLLVPALTFILALLLCATDTNPVLKFLFPLAAFAIIPLSYLLYELQNDPAITLEHLSIDLGLALIIALAPAILGAIMGLAARAVGKRQQKKSAQSQRSGRGVGVRGGMGSGARNSQYAGTRGNSRTAASRATPAGTGPRLRVVTHKRTGAGGPGTPGTTRRAPRP